MKNAEYIRYLSDEHLAEYLFKFEVNVISNFLTGGGENIRDAQQIKEWLNQEVNGKPIWEV